MFKILALIILLSYAIFLLYGLYHFLKAKYFSAESRTHRTKTCIVICARNEAANIERCLKSVINQNFEKTLLELILVNDASADNTLMIAQEILSKSNLKFQIISNPEKLGKKKSLTKAIDLTECELIITRDADTFTLSNNWLSTIVSYYEETSKQFIIAPVEVDNRPSLTAQLQRFEHLALAVITAGYALNKKAFLCNGANLAFTKRIFQEVGGYKNHQEVASGDDVLFLEDVKKTHPETISYLKNKDAFVLTPPVKGINNLLSQKIRWMKKTGVNPNPLNSIMGLTVLFVHLTSLFFISNTILVYSIPLLGIIFIFGRLFIDFLLLFLSSGYFNKPVNWLWFVPSSIVYSFYVTIITILSLFIKPKWK